ncbi:formyltetrahydrofolate deformylase [Alicyclobacillus sacchari]|uniref:Formyltetrahydrofolate deformylase n=1 Tax=Alicyclobacillus sacchari TaxID=392010 RepID=A0A4R8LX10_9BACL|nr:formyltetrahydrofolate deformylase [Alicyclobacillus sacchari]TDY51355.1 formyltetrahydrofolate deformylase [Alicyclobacillus sacchari]GMA56671.1 formyltetrahydrofolate deformylase [Alicyclobacillus sacchari]
MAARDNRGRLLISCPDRLGIVAAIGQFLSAHGANIAESAQYSTEPQGGDFFMRIEFELDDLAGKEDRLCEGFAQLANDYGMRWRYAPARAKKRMAIFVSRELHCLQELLWDWQDGLLDADVRMVVSNHPDARPLVESLGIPFHHIPVTAETKAHAEQRQLELLADDIDVIVLARYMQILSPSFLERFPQRIINIHHSFLPAFIGRNPYQRAYDRGVKLIGATAHYVTEELDEGPIIEQDVTRVDHRFDASDLRIAGRQVERAVLSRAVKWHLEDKVIVHGNKTIVFA